MQSPLRPPSHSPIDVTRLMKLAGELADIADNDEVAAAAIDELAEDNGVPREHYYAALPMADLQVAMTDDTQAIAVACVGGCQKWGAVDVLGALLDERDKASAKGTVLGVAVRACLDKCDGAAVVELRTPAGAGIIANADPEKIRGAFAELFEDDGA